MCVHIEYQWKALLLLWVGSTICGAAIPLTSRRRIPVIIDTDTGSFHDDFPAIAFALQSPELDIKLLVTCTDDTRARAKVAAKLLTLAGRGHIPIGIGVPTNHVTERPLFVWASDFNLSSYPGGVFEDGIARMGEMIRDSKRMVEVLALGPLTNFPRLLAEYPGVVHKARITAMGGAINVGYFHSSMLSAEYNIALCPRCASAVIDAGWSVRLAPLDVCIDAFLSPSLSKELFVDCRSSNNVSSALVETFQYFFPFWQFMYHENTHVNPVFYDTVATLMLLPQAHDYLAEYEKQKITVDNDGYTYANDTAGSLAEVATHWRVPAAPELFGKFLTQTLCI